MSILKIISDLEPKVGNVRFIAIDGHGGSGKSTLAHLLSKQLKAEIIHTDDFAGWDNPENWWPLVVERVFIPIQQGASTLSYPRSKWWETHNPEPVVNQPVSDIMILEGVSALREEFRQYLSFGIFVDTPIDVCIKRGFERDRGQDGKSDKEIMQMWKDWYDKEEVYMNSDKPKESADIVLDGTIAFDTQLSGK
jgi:uridine kinase